MNTGIKIVIGLALLFNGLFKVYAQIPGFGTDSIYGYTYRTSQTTRGIPFDWVDITSTGVQVSPIGDDFVQGTFNIGFPFNYYGTDQTQFHIGSNGYIGFTSSYNYIWSNVNPVFPYFPTNDTHENFLAPFLTDLSGDGSGNPARLFYYTNNSDSLVVTFENVPFWANNGNQYVGSNTFQIILNGVDSSISYQYLSMNGTWDSDYDGYDNQIAIGMESPSSTYGLEIAYAISPDDSLKITINQNCFSYGSVSNLTVCEGIELYNGMLVTSSGTYYDVLTASDGCDSIITTNITLTPAIQAADTFTLCKGDTLNVHGQLVVGGGIYEDTLQTISGCDSIVTSIVTLIEITDTIVIKSGQQLTAQANNASFQWYNCATGQPLNNETSATFSPSETGRYAVEITKNECTYQTKCYDVEVTTGSGTSATPTAICSFISISPNPSNSNFHIDAYTSFIETIQVFDVLGNEIECAEGNVLKLSKYPSGIYYVQLQIEGRVYTEKIYKN